MMNLFKNSKLLMFVLAIILFGAMFFGKNFLDNQSNNVEIQSLKSIEKGAKSTGKSIEKGSKKAGKSTEKFESNPEHQQAEIDVAEGAAD